MICPRCECTEIEVIDTRPTIEGNGTRRRRQCKKCHYRFTTYEQTRSDLLTTAKQLLEYEMLESIKNAMDAVFSNNNRNTCPYYDKEDL